MNWKMEKRSVILNLFQDPPIGEGADPDSHRDDMTIKAVGG